ncbi:MAG TPA: IPT/TIG domain-containing protein [Anaerolineales bacterium]|nr:IPT/TIG domain-containing protein [Anaerolineales bacterium]
METVAYFVGAITLIVLWLFYWMLAGTPNPVKLIEGADGRLSSSKLQWFMWTVVVFFAYTAVYTARISKGHWEVISEIPANVLTAMGFSIVTMAGAKGITASYVASGHVVKDSTDKPGLGSIFCDDDGEPDLSKIQMLAWTLIASCIYLSRLVQTMHAALPELPDIDPAMMVLMGLGQGAYLGKKLTTTDVPRITGVSPTAGPATTKVTLSGVSFGTSPQGNMITLDEMNIPLPNHIKWKDDEIKFDLPTTYPDGNGWKPGQTVQIGLIVGGQESANKLPFTITK